MYKVIMKIVLLMVTIQAMILIRDRLNRRGISETKHFLFNSKGFITIH